MISLGKIITPSEFFSTEYVQFLGYGLLAELYVPTEIVITEPKVCVPQTARVYRTELYIASDGSIVDYTKLREKESDFHGTSHYPYTYLWEVWEDCGDDGHKKFTLEGYVFLTSEMVEIPQDRIYPLEAMRNIQRKNR